MKYYKLILKVMDIFQRNKKRIRISRFKEIVELCSEMLLILLVIILLVICVYFIFVTSPPGPFS